MKESKGILFCKIIFVLLSVGTCLYLLLGEAILPAENQNESFGYFDYSFNSNDDEYIECLKTAAGCEGHNPEEIDYLIEQGFSLDEIEEYIYS